MAVEYRCCETGFFIWLAVVVLLVLFAGLMSGLTLGLMSMSLVDLEVIAKSGTPSDRKHTSCTSTLLVRFPSCFNVSSLCEQFMQNLVWLVLFCCMTDKILPVVKRQHLLLCTLLICNAAAMEALPIFLDSLVTAWGAILISVTLILLFGEIIPQAVCSRYGLAIGAAVAPVVRLLVLICFPVAYPISKLLDFLLGEGHEALFRRAELKTLVDLHGNEAGKGGELTRDETTIIGGALELTEKTAGDAMTPISETFCIDINSKLDRELMKLILEKGNSRVPVYHVQPRNIIGLVLVKNLLMIHPEDEIPVKNVSIRKIPRVSETMPLYDILNEFQKGHSHMAVVVRQQNNSGQSPTETATNVKEVRVEIDGERHSKEKTLTTNRSSLKKGSSSRNEVSLQNRMNRTKKWANGIHSEILQIDENQLPGLAGEGEEVIGLITMEDVIEELLQEEIYDEKDHPQ